MTGLIRKHLMLGHVEPVVILVYVAVAAVIGILFRNPEMAGGIVGALGGGFSIYFIIAMHAVPDRNWLKLEGVLPIKTAHIELSRYLSHVIVFLTTLLAITAYILVGYMRGTFRESYLIDILSPFASWYGMYFLVGAILFPALRLFSASKAKLAKIIGGALGIGLLLLIASATNNLLDMDEASRSILLVVIAFILFVMSYFLSLYLYKRRMSREGVL